MKRNTVFFQIIFRVLVPVFIGLLIMEVLTYFHTKKLLTNAEMEKELSIIDEIGTILTLRDESISLLDSYLKNSMEAKTNEIVKYIAGSNHNPITIDLKELQQKLNFIPDIEDIYIIDSAGTVVNTTFKADLNLNFFSFGERHEAMLRKVLKSDEFVAESFAIEAKTKRLKKYSYKATLDNKYIVELGFYSPKADSLIKTVNERLNHIGNKDISLVSVDLFIGPDNPFSLNPSTEISTEHLSVLDEVFSAKTSKIIQSKDNEDLKFRFIYMDRKHTDFYKSSVIRIGINETAYREFLQFELLKSVLLFVFIILIVSIIAYYSIKSILQPIRNLISGVDKITDVDFYERIEVVGKNELTELTKHFNRLLSRIEMRNEEIASLTSNINRINKDLNNAYEIIYNNKQDSIKAEKHILSVRQYALGIQTAVNAPFNAFKEIFPDSFLFLLPKDVVGGDFFWYAKIENNLVFAVADATGHATPGAMISMIGLFGLRNTVEIKGITNPLEIMQNLDKEFAFLLQTENSNSHFYDGLDIGIGTLDLNTGKLLYSGAKQQLYVVSNNIVQNLRGENISIGKFFNDAPKEFKLETCELQNGDYIYLSTNGLPDQYGDFNNTRFTTNRLVKLLTDNSNQSCDDQSFKIKKALRDWKGNEEQVDDILVFGFKFTKNE